MPCRPNTGASSTTSTTRSSIVAEAEMIMRSQLLRLVIAGLVGCLVVACGLSDDPTSPNPGDVPREPVVFAADSLAAVESITTESGLTVIHLEVGAGRQPGPGNHVFVHYTGMLVDGTIFDDSYTRGVPFDFALGQGRVIAGWDEGIALMKEGGRARLVIPPALAYGEAGQGNGAIPPGATLWFDVWLVQVN